MMKMQMGMLTRGVLAVSLLFGVAACGQKDGTPMPTPLGPDAGGSASSAAQLPAPLAGLWKLVSLQETGKAVVSVASPDHFTASFGSQGQVNLVADCNRCSGGANATDQNLRIGAMACTLAYCSSAPLDTQFSGLVGAATTWSVSGDSLSLISPSGTLRLKR